MNLWYIYDLTKTFIPLSMMFTTIVLMSVYVHFICNLLVKIKIIHCMATNSILVMMIKDMVTILAIISHTTIFDISAACLFNS